nr:reverse transcriptase domain-containing protein [Tanacetum cinerariifolium]
MSSLNHPTSDIDDAFSSNSPDYTPASPDYYPSSPRNTSSDSSNNAYGLVLEASPTLSLFHDDPYMKVMHAYDTIMPPQVPIPPPIIVPPSPILSPICNPQEFFVPKELLPLKEQVNILNRKKFYQDASEAPCKQIEDILNYLEDLSFHSIEKIEEILVNGWMIIQSDFDKLKTKLEKVRSQISRLQKKHIGQKDKIAFARFRISTLEITLKDIQARHQMDPKRTSTSAAPAMNQAAIWQLNDDRVAAALKAQAANMANTDNTNRNFVPRETPIARKLFSRSNCTEDCKVKFATGNDLKTYARRFQELSVLCPNMVPNTEKLMKVFIWGLPRSIEGNVTASKPQTLEKAINITQRLMDQETKHNSVQGTNDHKRKFDSRNIDNNNYQNYYDNNYNNCYNDHHQ